MDYKFKELVGKAKQDDKAAAMELLRQLKPLLLSAVKRYGWGLDSEEMLQEANLAVLDGIKSFDETRGVPFLSFIKTKVYFHVYNLSRKQRVIYSLNSSADDAEGQEYLDLLVDESANPMNDLVTMEQSAEVSAAFSLLPENQQQVLRLHFYNGINLKTIASRMGVSYKTVLRLRDRALVTMSENLTK